MTIVAFFAVWLFVVLAAGLLLWWDSRRTHLAARAVTREYRDETDVRLSPEESRRIWERLQQETDVMAVDVEGE